MNRTDLMIDLETLGTEPGSVITQIGLCAFDAAGGTTVAQLLPVHPKSCLEAGMKMSWETVAWWLVQSEEARAALLNRPMIPLRTAIENVNAFARHYCQKGFKVWGNGSSFDVVLIEDAYRRVALEPLWGFRDIRDMRTLAALCPTVERVKPALEHDACADAQAQALTVQKYMASLRASQSVA